MDIDHDEQFGFTDDEVMKLLSDYDRSERYPDVKNGMTVIILRRPDPSTVRAPW